MLTSSEWVTKLDRVKTCDADTMVTKLEINSMLEDFNQKLTRSGYNITRRRKIFKAGLLGYKRKMRRTLIETGGHRHKTNEDGGKPGS